MSQRTCKPRKHVVFRLGKSLYCRNCVIVIHHAGKKGTQRGIGTGKR